MTKKEIRKTIAKHYSIVASHLNVDRMIEDCGLTTRRIKDVVCNRSGIAFLTDGWCFDRTGDGKIIRWEDYCKW